MAFARIRSWEAKAPQSWTRIESVVLIILVLVATLVTAAAALGAVLGMTGFCDVECERPSSADQLIAAVIVACPSLVLALIVLAWRRRLPWAGLIFLPPALLFGVAFLAMAAF